MPPEAVAGAEAAEAVRPGEEGTPQERKPQISSRPVTSRRPAPEEAASTVAGLAEASRSNKHRPDGGGGSDRRPPPWLIPTAIAAVIVLIGAFLVTQVLGDDNDEQVSGKPGAEQVDADGKPAVTVTPTTAGLAPEPEVPYDGWVDPASSGEPWSTDVVGQLTFRGNPTRSYYGLGPVPKAPEIQWRYPSSGGMCGQSSVGGVAKSWCGTGWTGQPSVWEEDGRTWVSFGAYDKNVHFLDGADGSEITGGYDMTDIIKGSVTRDPDGYPLLYSGSRADFHILAMDRDDGQAATLWSMSADDVSPTKWNNDWDSSPLVIDDYLFEGGENGQWYVIKLNRDYGDDGKVTVDPEVVFHAPAWDDQLLSDLAGSGSRVNDVSIENSLAISGNTVYFTNSGGLLQGWDISGVKDGKDPERTFRFWSGDDTDASVVIDKEGMLYIAQQVERASTSARSTEVGQLVKIDPTKPDDPIVWSVSDPRGMWATPAISGGVVISPTDSGRIVGVDQMTGEILWEKDLPGPTWSSPVVVDDVWIQGDCLGFVHGFDFSNPRVDPPELWTVELEGCVESTPTVFKGQIFVGARGGAFYALGDPA
ncbi:MAG: PQQ-binding-like beta-propeller repeat protein [Aquihabitans sp.]